MMSNPEVILQYGILDDRCRFSAAILYEALEHLQILASVRGSWKQSPVDT